MHKELKELHDMMKTQEPLHDALVQYVEDCDVLDKILRHPLVYAVPYFPQMNAMYNKQYEQKTDHAAHALLNSKYSTFVFLHERAYRLDALRMLYETTEIAANSTEFWQLFRSIWIDTENWWHNADDVAEWIDDGGAELMMHDSEREHLASMPDSFTVYRGWSRHGGRCGYSWTTDRDIAEFFATRFARCADQRHAKIAAGVVKRHDVLAYLTSRDESEMFVDIGSVSNVETYAVQ